MTEGIDLRLRLSTALEALAEFEHAQHTLQTAERLASALNDVGRLGQVLSRMSRVLRELGDHDEAMKVGHRAAEIADGLADPALQAWVCFPLSQAHIALGEFCASGRAPSSHSADVACDQIVRIQP